MAEFDSWPSLQDFVFEEFSFRANGYNVWEGGRLIRTGKAPINVFYKCNGGVHNRTSIDIRIQGNPVPDIMMSNIRYDRGICLPDRIMFYSTAEISNIKHQTLIYLSSFVGYTRSFKTYEDNEPVVASVFTINKSVVQVSFSLANPDRLIEFGVVK